MSKNKLYLNKALTGPRAEHGMSEVGKHVKVRILVEHAAHASAPSTMQSDVPPADELVHAGKEVLESSAFVVEDKHLRIHGARVERFVDLSDPGWTSLVAFSSKDRGPRGEIGLFAVGSFPGHLVPHPIRWKGPVAVVGSRAFVFLA